MNRHADRTAFLNRIEPRMDELVSECKRPVFRFVDPQYSSVDDMFAGKGASHANGRWLRKGKRLATYTATDPETALAESLAAGRYYGFPDESSAPLVFVTARVRLRRVIDLSDGKLRQRLQIAERTLLECDWRQCNGDGEEAITQAWGWAFAKAGAEGIIAPSAAYRGGSNVIVFPENLRRSDQLKVIKEVQWPNL